jgi:vacuolar-type H+-ATPase subunit I/STV1
MSLILSNTTDIAQTTITLKDLIIFGVPTIGVVVDVLWTKFQVKIFDKDLSRIQKEVKQKEELVHQRIDKTNVKIDEFQSENNKEFKQINEKLNQILGELKGNN